VTKRHSRTDPRPTSNPRKAAITGRLQLTNQRRRFGYRRLFILLRREGEPSGINRIYRLYREEGLTICKRRARLGRRKSSERMGWLTN
jgi:hypothetical protein